MGINIARKGKGKKRAFIINSGKQHSKRNWTRERQSKSTKHKRAKEGKNTRQTHTLTAKQIERHTKQRSVCLFIRREVPSLWERQASVGVGERACVSPIQCAAP